MALEAASGATAWMLALPDTSVHLTTPAMAGSTVYVAGGDGVVRALMLRTGMVRWTWTGGAAIVATSVVDTTAGVLYVGDLRGRLVALELTNGRLRWETRLEDGVLELIGSPFGLIALTRPRHVYLLQSDHETVASRP
nr:PQQ-binding-like beta-propeller repeat protein [Rhodothermus marinus]